MPTHERRLVRVFFSSVFRGLASLGWGPVAAEPEAPITTATGATLPLPGVDRAPGAASAAQRRLQHLAAVALGETVHELHHPGRLVRRERAPDVRLERLLQGLSRRVALVEHHERIRFLQ